MPSRLSPLDASFLAVETPTAHMHVGFAAVFEPPEDAPPPGYPELLDHIDRRIARAPRYRQKLCPTPLGVNAPIWADDAAFSISRHVHRAPQIRLPDVIEASMSEPLPRDRPLWEIRLADRLDDGRIGVVGKAHHCMVDGLATVELASLLLDPVPDPPAPPARRWKAEPPPAPAIRFGEGIADLARAELELALLPARLLGKPGRARKMAARARRALTALQGSIRPAPKARTFNTPISPRRRLGLLRRPLDDLVQVKRAFGVKLNDVVLAASAGAVRRFLQQRDEDPISLKTMVPVSVRDPDERDALGNRISFMFVDLPCEEPDPVRRLQEISGATMERKERGEPEGAEDVMRAIGLAPAPLQRIVSRLVASPRAFNLTVSNIPGPREPLYMRGCRLAEAYPIVPIADGHTLSIGFTTILDEACFGIYGDPKSLPDLGRLGPYLDAAIEELLEAGERRPAQHEGMLVAGG